MAGGSELAEFVIRFGSSSWCKESSKGDERRASAFCIKGVESGEFLAGIKAAAESTN
jgi:hypothetical protein